MFALNGILQKIYFHFIEEKYDGNKYYHYKIKITDEACFEMLLNSNFNNIGSLETLNI